MPVYFVEARNVAFMRKLRVSTSTSQRAIPVLHRWNESGTMNTVHERLQVVPGPGLVPAALVAAPRGFKLPTPAEGVKPKSVPLPSPLQSRYEFGSPCLATPVIHVTTFDYKIATLATRARLLTSNVWLQRTQKRSSPSGPVSWSTAF